MAKMQMQMLKVKHSVGTLEFSSRNRLIVLLLRLCVLWCSTAMFSRQFLVHSTTQNAMRSSSCSISWINKTHTSGMVSRPFYRSIYQENICWIARMVEKSSFDCDCDITETITLMCLYNGWTEGVTKEQNILLYFVFCLPLQFLCFDKP